MNIKKIIATILLIVFCNMNVAYAENWVLISAENGKFAGLDLDSIDVWLDTVEYDISTVNGDVTYINRFSTELYKDKTPTAVIKTTKFVKGKEVSSETVKERKYRELKSGTLQAEIYDVISKKINEEDFAKVKKVRNKYLKNQRRYVSRRWIFYDRDKARLAKDAYHTATFDINKKGEIVSMDYKNASALMVSKIEKFDPLPKDYISDTYSLKVQMFTYKYAGAKYKTPKPYYMQLSPTSGEITVARNSSLPVLGLIRQGILNMFNFGTEMIDYDLDLTGRTKNLLCLLAIPIDIVMDIFMGRVIVGYVIAFFSYMLMFVTGGDMSDCY
ncbi:MAG: hypothetical protein K6E29_07680 [Cyanobacteria bacterium RUI128]|nr:hypothetical protein [Cyanobacteria bacterium RUI128]